MEDAQFTGANLNWGVLPATNEEGILKLSGHCCNHRILSHLCCLKTLFPPVSTRTGNKLVHFCENRRCHLCFGSEEL